jgi:hypothetical protein
MTAIITAAPLTKAEHLSQFRGRVIANTVGTTINRDTSKESA